MFVFRPSKEAWGVWLTMEEFSWTLKFKRAHDAAQIGERQAVGCFSVTENYFSFWGWSEPQITSSHSVLISRGDTSFTLSGQIFDFHMDHHVTLSEHTKKRAGGVTQPRAPQTQTHGQQTLPVSQQFHIDANVCFIFMFWTSAMNSLNIIVFDIKS